nr:DUF3039 domain-containing protein [Streptomyces endocoffeicus]
MTPKRRPARRPARATDTQRGSNTDTNALIDSIVENEERVKDDGAGDHDRLSHYVSKEDIVRSSMTGEPSSPSAARS